MKKIKKEKQIWWLGPIIMFINLSGWIIIPLLAGLIVGRWLDKKFNTEPWLFLILTGMAFIVSMIGLVRNTIREYNRITKNNSKEQDGERYSDN